MASLINIRSAIQEWQNSICITFKERNFEEDYIEFAYEGGYGIETSSIHRYSTIFKGTERQETALGLLWSRVNNSCLL